MRHMATQPATNRRALFSNTADNMGMTGGIVEKDFWVCWVRITYLVVANGKTGWYSKGEPVYQRHIA